MAKSDCALVTIGLSCFNAGATLERAIESALVQNWTNKEILIVDDASTDNSKTILQQYEKYDQIRILYRQINGGVATVRNDIIDLANGEYLAFFDDDDKSLPSRITDQVDRILLAEKIEKKKNKFICYTGRILYSGRSKCKYIPPIHSFTRNISESLPGKDVAEYILTGTACKRLYGSTATCTQFARISTFKILGCFDDEFRRSEDTEFAIRSGIKGFNFISINEPLVEQFSSPGNEKTAASELYNTLKYITKHRDFIDTVSSAFFCEEWVKLKFGLKNFLIRDFVNALYKMLSCFPKFFVLRIIWTLKILIFRIFFYYKNKLTRKREIKR